MKKYEKELNSFVMSLSAKSRNSRETRYSCDISRRVLMPGPQDVQTWQSKRGKLSEPESPWMDLIIGAKMTLLSVNAVNLFVSQRDST